MITLTISKTVNIGLLSYIYKHLVFCGQFATVTVTFVNNFADLSAHYFQNLRECLTAALYPDLAVEDLKKQSKLISYQVLSTNI